MNSETTDRSGQTKPGGMPVRAPKLYQHRFIYAAGRTALVAAIATVPAGWYFRSWLIVAIAALIATPIWICGVTLLLLTKQHIEKTVAEMADLHEVVLQVSYMRFVLSHPLAWSSFICGVVWSGATLLTSASVWLVISVPLLFAVVLGQLCAFLYWAFLPLPVGLRLVFSRFVVLKPVELAMDGPGDFRLGEALRHLYFWIRGRFETYYALRDTIVPVGTRQVTLPNPKDSIQDYFRRTMLTANYIAHRMSLFLILAMIVSSVTEFGAIYWAVSRLRPLAFSNIKSPVDALFLAVGVMATFGFTSVSPASTVAKVITMSQAATNVLAFVVALFSISVMTNTAYETLANVLNTAVTEIEQDVADSEPTTGTT